MRIERTATGKPMDREWHRRRQEIRERVYAESELSPEEQVSYDVGADKAYPIGHLPSVENDEVFKTDPDLYGGTGHRKRVDIRELDGH